MIKTEESLDLLRNWLRAVGTATGLLVLLLGVVVIFGWHTSNQRLVQIYSGFAPMQYNTALAFFLCGSGMLLLIFGQRRSATICGIVAACLGGLTLSQDILGTYIPGFQLGIDELLMSHKLTTNTPTPGRMAPNTAICFMLAGSCIALRPTRNLSPVHSIAVALLASTALGLSVVAMSGHLTHLRMASRWGELTQMAIHTSIGFAILSAGLLLLQWRRDVCRETWVPKWMPITLAVAAMTATICFWQALSAEGVRINRQFPDLKDFTNVTNLATLTLIIGTVLALTLAAVAYLSQKSYSRAWQLDKANLSLWSEIETRREAERALEAHRDNLERAVVARTRELEAARQDAEAANHAKSEFLSHMSHELRTPLNGILGYAQILQRHAQLADDEQQQLDGIVSCGDHLLSLINDVLDLSKIEAQRVDVDPAPLELSKLVKGVAGIVREKAERKELALHVDVSPAVPPGIVTDGAKLRQILINLLGNAVKFTQRGSVQLHVHESPRGTLRFDVIDTGIGMSTAEIAQIFDPFKQVEAGKAAGGTGLGLAITKNLAELLGATVSVHSQRDEGSTFSLALPLVEAASADWPASSDTNETQLGRSVLAEGQSCTILIADDRDVNRHVLSGMLRPIGFKLLEATDGDEAIQRLRAHPEIALILMDVRMPRVSGLEAVEQIRQDAQLKKTKVIAVTASVHPEFRRQAIAAGFDDFLGKPLHLDELLAKLKQHLNVTFEPSPPASHRVEGHFSSPSPQPESHTPTCHSMTATQLQQLHTALRIKNVTAINAIALQLESDPRSETLGNRIRTLARQFDFSCLQSLLAELEHREDDTE